MHARFPWPSLSGKTEATKEHLKAHKLDRGLCVTFRRSLAKKLTDDFGFVSYRTLAAEKQSVIKAYHLVVQMDSVWRVENRPYNVVILDEAPAAANSRSSLTSQIGKDPSRVYPSCNHIR